MLNGAMAVVTGGTAGIGRACAEGLLGAGAGGVLINGRDAARAERARAEIAARFPGARVVVALGDVAQPGVAEAVMAAAMRELGRIDILVNSTGGNDLPRLLFRIPPAEIPGILERCLHAQLLCCAAALPHLRAGGGGAVVNIASDAGKIPTPGESVIGAAMAGIVMFTRALAVEGKRDGIRANVLTPSLTSGTEHYEKVMADPFAGKLFAKAAKMAALGVVDKTELAGLAVFLASPAAAKITGQAISMTGGISAL
jgi:NAD(P)-dependent dehydrogenase (short-subunit alcohol dehydrogenase family)